jgi:periplasmic copper chaperone A
MQHRIRPGRTLVAAVSLVLAASLAACSGSASASPTAPASGGITVTGAWVRNSPAVAGAVAGYLVIRNDGSAADALVGASSPIAKTVEMHRTVDMSSAVPSPACSGATGGMASPACSNGTGGSGSGGMLGMVPVSRIDVPAGGSVELKPGGYHLMMLDPAAGLTVGQTVDITLRFEKAGTITVKAEVRAS